MLQFGSRSARTAGVTFWTRYSTMPTIVFKSKPGDKSESTPEVVSKTVEKSNLVAAAFASLSNDDNIAKLSKTVTKKFPKKNNSDDIIEKATTVDALLVIADNAIISRRHALKVVSILADWSSSGKVKLSDFEADPRFQKLCRILGRNGTFKAAKQPSNRMSMSVGDDLSTVLGIAGDDEAAKLVASISLPQMVKVLSALAQKRRRSTPLLRSLANNITKSTDKMDLKQCADVLFAAATLNFPDIPLLEKASSNLCEKLLLNTTRSSVVGSVLTSVGILRYKNPELLDAISDWMVKYQEICRPQDIFALFVTLGSINYKPNSWSNVNKILMSQLNVADAPKPSLWVDLILSLSILNAASVQHVESVLHPDFIAKLQGEGALSIPVKLKLLSIQAAATHFLNYNGPLISNDSEITTVTISRSREKQTLVASMLDSLSNLLPSVSYLRSNIDTGMGFLLDGECLLDNKCNPLPLTETPAPGSIKVAFMAQDYHDLCRCNRCELTGMNALAHRLLEKKGYNVISVSHTEFNPRDKLTRRVQYLEKLLKDVVQRK